MKKIVFILIVFVISFNVFSQYKDGQKLFEKKPEVLIEYYVDELSYVCFSEYSNYYHFLVGFIEKTTYEEMSIEFNIAFSQVDFKKIKRNYIVELDIVISCTSGYVFAYPVIRYSGVKNNYEEILILEE